MATQQLNFNIRIGYDDAAVGPGAQRTEAQLRGVVSEVERVAREMAAARNRTIAAADGFNRLGISLTNAAKGFAAYQAGSMALNLGQTARTLQDMEIRLQGVTSATGGYAQAEQFLIDLATRHHKTLTGLADGYTSLLGLEESGIITRKEAQRMMEGLSNAQSKYGTTTEQIKNSLYGLSQALSASTVQMDELHQVTDPMPGLLTRMEKAAGVASGGFKDMAEKGRLTRDIVKDSLIKTLDDLDGAAAKTAGTMTASINDMQREWELLAKATEEPITLIVNVSTGAASQALKTFREAFETAQNFWNSNDLNGYSLPDLQANLGYLQKAGPETDLFGNINAAGQKNHDYEIKQYQDAIALKQAEIDKRNAAQTPTNTQGFTGPGIPDDVLKQRKKDAEALQEQYQKLLEQAGNYRESLTLEAKAKGLSEEASRTYVEQGLKLIAQKDAEKASRTANRSAINSEKETRQTAIQTIEDERKAMERRTQTLLADADAEKAIELIRAGTDRTAQLEIESRHIENERVLNQQRLQSEIAYDQQLLQTTRDRSQAAELTQQLAQNQTALNAVNDDASKSLERLKAAEQARGDALLQQLNTDTADKQQLGTLAQRLAMEGQTAEQIERQLAAKAQILQIERDNPNRPDITQAAIRNIDQEQTYRQVLDDTRAASEQYAELWKDAARRVDDSFQKMWEGVISGQSSFGKSLKTMLNSTMAEMAHALITKPLENQLLVALGGGSSSGSTSGISGLLTQFTGNTSTSGGSSSGIAADFINGVKTSSTDFSSTIGSAVSGIGDVLGSAGKAIGGLFSNGSGGSTAPSADAAAQGSLLFSKPNLPNSPTSGAGPQFSPTANASTLANSGSFAQSAGQFAGNMGIGMSVGNLAQSFGLKGSNGLANTFTPMIGSAIGTAIGGPVGSALGGLLGSAISMLFKAAVPNARVDYRYSQGGYEKFGDWKHAGGDIKGIRDIASSLGDPLQSIERLYGAGLGNVIVRSQQYDNSFKLRGVDDKGEFFYQKDKYNEKGIKRVTDSFMVAVAQRDSVLNQIDDELIRESVRYATSTDELQANYAKAIKVRSLQGLQSSGFKDIEQLRQDFSEAQATLKSFTKSGAIRDISNDTQLLLEGVTRQFNEAARSVKNQMSELSGLSSNASDALSKISDSLRDLINRDKEMADFARKANIAYSQINLDDLVTAARTARHALQDELIQQLKSAAGQTDSVASATADLSQQFRQFAADAKTLGVSLDAVAESLLSAFSNLAEQTRKPLQDAAASLSAALSELKGQGIDTAKIMANAMSALNNQIVSTIKDSAGKITRIGTDASAGMPYVTAAQTAILANFQAQKQAADALSSSYKQIADYAAGMKLGSLSIAAPKAKMDAAKKQWDDLYKAATGKDETAKTAALPKLTGAADAYLQNLINYTGPTADYQKVFDDLQQKLTSLSAAATATDYAAEAVTALGKVQDQLKILSDNTTAAIKTGADTLAATGMLTTEQQQILQSIADGVTYGKTGSVQAAVGDLATGLRASVQIAGLDQAVKNAVASGNKLDDKESKTLVSSITGIDTARLTTADLSLLTDLKTYADVLKQSADLSKNKDQSDNASKLASALDTLITQGNAQLTAKYAPATAAPPTITATNAAAVTPTVQLTPAVKTLDDALRNAPTSWGTINPKETQTLLGLINGIAPESLNNLDSANLKGDLAFLQQLKNAGALTKTDTQAKLADSVISALDALLTANAEPTKGSKKAGTAAANDPDYNVVDLKPLTDALGAKGELAARLDTLAAQFDGKAPLQTTLTGIQAALGDKSTLAVKLTNLNTKLSEKGELAARLDTLTAQFDGKAPLQTTLTDIQAALGDKSTLAVKLTNLNTKLSEKGELAARLDTLTAQFDGKAPLQTTLTGIQTALSEDSPLANKLTNVNAKLTGLNKKTDDAQTTREAIQTGIEALPPLLTAISTGNQTAATTLAGGLAGFGKALTDGLSSLGSAIYSGMNQVGNAVGAKITDLNTALKTTQNQLATANSALAQAQTALIQAQTAKTPVAITAPAKSVSIGTAPTLTPTATTAPAKSVNIGTPPTLPARASGGPAQGWTLVGEQGPELVRFPVPVQVYSNDQSRSLLKDSGNQNQTEIIASLRRLIELQAATIATLQQQGRNQSEQLDGLHREFARFSGKVRLAA